MEIYYDRKVIESFAHQLYKKAEWTVVSETCKYGFFSSIATFAASFLMSHYYGFGGFSQYGLLIFGSIVGCYFGYQNGQINAFNYRLEAQRALCYVQIELNTSKTGVMKTVA